jgi:sterol desaturase/sphingolipid hydroxylase (fatty acid hydroxylase superfamily)
MNLPIRDAPTSCDDFRQRVMLRWGRWYSPWFHLLAPGAIGLALVGCALSRLRHPTAIELLTVVPCLVMLNGLEWYVHREFLHRRQWGFYDRHTPEHHGVFRHDDMEIRSRREFALVLIPDYALVTMFLGVAPIAFGLALLDLNLGLLFYAVAVAYALAYEWMHLLYHLPRPVRGWPRWVEALRQHHATHHDHRLMQSWNFNTTVPIWDSLLGTRYGDPRAAGIEQSR